LTTLRARSTVVCVGSPITIGALSATAPPSEARSATGHHAPAQRAGLDDRTLIDAVRAGNVHAYGTLYERHVGAVRGLARRLCGNRADADDVVADVFTNTLRAIKSGRGPRDDLRPYVLTSTRHTVIKLRTRHDSGRAIPTAHEQLDRPVTDDMQRADGVDTIGAAFGQLPDRFRNVLWLSCVEDLAPAEVGRHTDLSAGAVSSLTLRARRALARSYLISRITQPIVSADCVTIRDVMPSIVRDEAAAGTIVRVDRHLASCCECREAFDEMQSLAGSLRTFPWFAAVLAWLRSIAVRVAPEAFGGLGGAAGLAPVVVTAVAILTFTSGDAPVVVPPAPAHVVNAAAAPPAAAVSSATPVASVDRSQPTTPSLAPGLTSRRSSDPPAPVADPATREQRSTTELREGGVPTPLAPLVGGTSELVDATVSDPTEMVVNQLDPVTALVGGATQPVEAVVGGTLDAVDQLGPQVASTTETLADSPGHVLDAADQTVVGALQAAGADELAATIEPVLDTMTEVVSTQVLEPVTDVVVATTVDTPTLVTATTSDLLGSSVRH